MSGRRARNGKINARLERERDAEELLFQRIKDHERRLDNAEFEAQRERLKNLSDAEIKVRLERVRERDEHDGVPRTRNDDLRDLGLLEPDICFLLKHVKGVEGVPDEEQLLALHGAFLTLLDSDIPLSPRIRRFLKWQLLFKWYPNQKRENREYARFMAELMRADLERAKAEKPVAEAKAVVAKRYGRNSGEALRKALQPNRLNRRARG